MLHSEPESYIIQKQKDDESKRKRFKIRNYLDIFASAKKIKTTEENYAYNTQYVSQNVQNSF